MFSPTWAQNSTTRATRMSRTLSKEVFQQAFNIKRMCRITMILSKNQLEGMRAISHKISLQLIEQAALGIINRIFHTTPRVAGKCSSQVIKVRISSSIAAIGARNPTQMPVQ